MVIGNSRLICRSNLLSLTRPIKQQHTTPKGSSQSERGRPNPPSSNSGYRAVQSTRPSARPTRDHEATTARAHARERAHGRAGPTRPVGSERSTDATSQKENLFSSPPPALSCPVPSPHEARARFSLEAFMAGPAPHAIT
jgi:hypothetical protein